jgi:hypothetical protein
VRGILKWPLIVAAVVIVLRVIVEQYGAPDSVANLFSVVALHFAIGPIYFAIMLARSGMSRPYGELLKVIGLYVVLTRAMVLPTYWLARIYHWPQQRFGGLADATPFTGFITIPFQTAAIWIVLSLVFGGVCGSIIIAIVRQFGRKLESAGVTE